MLNDRERRSLAAIEEQLCHSDPRLARQFHSLDGARPRRPRERDRGRPEHRSVHSAGTIPCAMLAVAMVLLVAGATTGMMPVVVVGVVMALLTLGVAATSAPRPGPGFA